MVTKKSTQHLLPNEEEIVSRAKAGDKEAYRFIVEAYQDRIFSLVLGMVHDPTQAEDLTQDIFIKTYFALPTFSGDAQLYTWIYRIATNRCLDYLRKYKPPILQLDQPLDEEERLTPTDQLKAPVPEQPDAAFESEGEINKLLMLIPPEERLVLTLREVEGYSYEEMADLLKCTVNTIKSRIYRAREVLKAAYIHRFGNIPESKNV